MNDRILEILLGHIPEAIYFALFIIFAKKLKTRRIIFVIIAVVEYLLVFNVIRYSIWSHILFFILMYLLLKMLYKERTQITDIFTMGVASVFLILISILSYILVYMITNEFYIYAVTSKIILFILLFLIKSKLNNIQKVYKKFWNRNDKISKRMKSTTFRALNTILFNVMFFMLNLGIIIAGIFFGR